MDATLAHFHATRPNLDFHVEEFVTKDLDVKITNVLCLAIKVSANPAFNRFKLPAIVKNRLKTSVAVSFSLAVGKDAADYYHVESILAVRYATQALVKTVLETQQ